MANTQNSINDLLKNLVLVEGSVTAANSNSDANLKPDLNPDLNPELRSKLAEIKLNHAKESGPTATAIFYKKTFETASGNSKQRPQEIVLLVGKTDVSAYNLAKRAVPPDVITAITDVLKLPKDAVTDFSKPSTFPDSPRVIHAADGPREALEIIMRPKPIHGPGFFAPKEPHIPGSSVSARSEQPMGRPSSAKPK